MPQTHQLRKNFNILFWGKALIELNILNSIITLFYLHRGVGIDKIFYLGIIWSLTALLFEVPTGYLADRFGRKRTMLLGALLLVISWIATLFATGFPAFIGIFILMSASFSCFSGTEEAFLYDTLKEANEERAMTKYTGKLHSAQYLFNIFLPMIGAWIAKDLTELQFVILILINMFASMGGMVMLSFLREPKHTENVAEYEKGIFRESVNIIKQEPFLFRAAMNKLLIFIASFVAWRAYQPFLTDRGLDVVWLGIFYFLMHGINFMLNQYVDRIEKRTGQMPIIIGSVIIMIGSLVGIFITHSVWLLFIFILIALTTEAIRKPVFAYAMNRRILSRSRATTLSNLNVFKSILDIPILLLTGWFAKTHIEYAFIVAIVLCVIALIFFPIHKRDIVEKVS